MRDDRRSADDVVGDEAVLSVRDVDVVAVIVPAHDEEERVDATLVSIDRSARAQSVPVIGVVVLDACSDATELVVRSHAEVDDGVDWHIVSTSVRRASSARQAGLDHLVRHFVDPSRSSDVAVLSTDADTIVPLDWISHHVRSLSCGADAVAGIVELIEADDIDHGDWLAEYTAHFRSDGTHPHVHCANLSVRLDMLLAAGGFGDLTRAEDIDLWKRLAESTTARLVSDQSSVVRTSSRADGRVTGGFATALERFRPPPVATGSVDVSES